jgi:hypothetical protein
MLIVLFEGGWDSGRLDRPLAGQAEVRAIPADAVRRILSRFPLAIAGARG